MDLSPQGMYLQIPSCWENTKGLKNTEMEEEIVAMKEGEGRSWQKRDMDKIDLMRASTQHQ